VSRLVFPAKAPSEILTLTFPFLSRLAVGETISSATVSATVYSGTDASPSAILSGGTTISGSEVKQKVTGGVLGVTYLLTCSAVTSTGQNLALSGFLSIAPAASA
jgi:hypothetical protein